MSKAKFLKEIRNEIKKQQEEFEKNGTPITLVLVDETKKLTKEDIEKKIEDMKILRRQKYKSLRQEEKNWKRKTITEYNK